MAKVDDNLRRHVRGVLDTLPEEALEEVAAFLDYQRFKLGRGALDKPPYEPVALGGLWASTRIGDEDIEDIRREMWGQLAEREL
jgi:hypothetical protein